MTFMATRSNHDIHGSKFQPWQSKATSFNHDTHGSMFQPWHQRLQVPTMTFKGSKFQPWHSWLQVPTMTFKGYKFQPWHSKATSSNHDIQRLQVPTITFKFQPWHSSSNHDIHGSKFQPWHSWLQVVTTVFTMLYCMILITDNSNPKKHWYKQVNIILKLKPGEQSFTFKHNTAMCNHRMYFCYQYNYTSQPFRCVIYLWYVRSVIKQLITCYSNDRSFINYIEEA